LWQYPNQPENTQRASAAQISAVTNCKQQHSVTLTVAQAACRSVNQRKAAGCEHSASPWPPGLPGHAGMPASRLLCMLTRSGVAERLGRSIATVRRMEGTVLHSTKDERGFNRFDPEEVERLARGDRSLRRGAKPHRTADLDLIPDDAGEILAEAEDEQWWRDWAKRQREQVERLEATRQRLEAERAAERRQREQQQAEWELICLEEEHRQLIGSLTPREIQRLSEEDLEALTELLES
jgi:hypothetical protein